MTWREGGSARSRSGCPVVVVVVPIAKEHECCTVDSSVSGMMGTLSDRQQLPALNGNISNNAKQLSAT
eukprot:17395-Heterococcus_DN1.PRE.4